MIQEASVNGLIRTVFIIIGIIAALRFIGKILIAKRESDKAKDIERLQREIEKAKKISQENTGKTSIHRRNERSGEKVLDVDFEEIDD